MGKLKKMKTLAKRSLDHDCQLTNVERQWSQFTTPKHDGVFEFSPATWSFVALLVCSMIMSAVTPITLHASSATVQFGQRTLLQQAVTAAEDLHNIPRRDYQGNE